MLLFLLLLVVRLRCKHRLAALLATFLTRRKLCVSRSLGLCNAQHESHRQTQAQTHFRHHAGWLLYVRMCVSSLHTDMMHASLLVAYAPSCTPVACEILFIADRRTDATRALAPVDHRYRRTHSHYTHAHKVRGIHIIGMMIIVFIRVRQ